MLLRLSILLAAAAAAAEVSLYKLPEGAIQPQCVRDEKDAVHLIYFKGDASGGDLLYAALTPGSRSLSQPLRVNSTPGTAVAVGTIRGGQIAAGQNGRVHVVWNGGGKKKSENGRPEIFYARLNNDGRSFESQKNIMQWTGGLDGGASVAADIFGNVYVAWHAWEKAVEEKDRRVYLSRSTDGGSTFCREFPIDVPGMGACGCCGLKAFAGRNGNVQVLYRAAGENIHRDMRLLVSRDRGKTFSDQKIHPWEVQGCPMSSAAMVEAGEGILLAWETQGQVYFARGVPGSGGLEPFVFAPGEDGGRKHPVLAAGSDGNLLFAWTEGTGWKKGGGFAWRLFDGNGKPLGEQGERPGAVPVWGNVAAAGLMDGSYRIFY